MHSLALRFWDDADTSSVPAVPRLLLIVVFLLTLGRRFCNWFLAPLRRFQILEETSYEYPHTLWPIALSTTNNNSLTFNSHLFFPSSSSSPINNPLQTIRENLQAVVEYGSLGADPQDDVTCAVCLIDFAARDRIRRLGKCGHVFHMECLDKWIDYQRFTCPLCRSPAF